MLMRNLELKRVYRHFKGDYYLVEDIATYSETGESCVVYRKLYEDGSLWVRPYSMFMSEVDKEKYSKCIILHYFEFSKFDIEIVLYRKE